VRLEDPDGFLPLQEIHLAHPVFPTHSSPTSSAHEWRCRGCGKLLGVLRNGEVHTKYKDVEQWTSGRCRQTCARCGMTNVVDTASAAPPATSGGSAR